MPICNQPTFPTSCDEGAQQHYDEVLHVFELTKLPQLSISLDSLHVQVHAAEMKENHLKNKPERRTWVEAAPFFKWTCGNYPEVHAARTHTSFKTQLDTAMNFRQEGNELYSKGEWDDALMKCACMALDSFMLDGSFVYELQMCHVQIM
jgi:hypothetical protein